MLIRFNSDPLGTQFTYFTGTKVQVLTQKALLARDYLGNTPFQLACANGAEEASLYLMERMMKHDAAWAVNSG